MILLPNARHHLRRPVLDTLVRRDLRVRYSRSLLGYVWTVLDPLADGVGLLRRLHLHLQGRAASADKPYFLYLLSGLLAWQWFTASVNDTTKSPDPGGPAGPVDEPAARDLGHPVRRRQGRRVRAVAAGARRLRHLLPRRRAGRARLGARALPARRWCCSSSCSSGSGCSSRRVTVLATDMQRVVRIVLRMSSTSRRSSTAPTPCRTACGRSSSFNPLNGILSLYRGGLSPRDLTWVDVGVSAVITVVLLVVGLLAFARLERAVLKEI